jgi:hypothetical protein
LIRRRGGFEHDLVFGDEPPGHVALCEVLASVGDPQRLHFERIHRVRVSVVRRRQHQILRRRPRGVCRRHRVSGRRQRQRGTHHDEHGEAAEETVVRTDVDLHGHRLRWAFNQGDTLSA